MTDITRKRGDTYSIEFVILEDDTPLDITGCTFILTVDPSKAPTDDTTKLFSLTGVILDAAAGSVSFTPTEEEADHVGKFFYDVQLVDGAGKKRTVAAGKFVLVQDITKT